MLSDVFCEVRRLLVFAFNKASVNVFNNPVNNTKNKVLKNSHTKHFLPIVTISNHSVLVNGRNVYNQPINDLVKQYGEIKKTVTEKGDDYTTGCLLDYH